MATTSDGIPYVGPTQYAEPADYPAIDEDQALAIQGLITTLKNQVAAMQPLLVPTGTVVAYGGSTAPTGWLLCNGAVISGTYSALIALVGANTPNLTNRFIVGAAMTGINDRDGSAALYNRGTYAGSRTVTVGTANMPSHSHGGAVASGNAYHRHAVWSGNDGGVDHLHGFGTGWMNQNASHSHAALTREGITTGDSEWYIDTADGSAEIRWNTVQVQATDTNHTHSGTTNAMDRSAAHAHGVDMDWQNASHTHGITAEGGGAAIVSEPKYWALTYIIKT